MSGVLRGLILIAIVAGLGLSTGCGRKGALESPAGTASQAEESAGDARDTSLEEWEGDSAEDWPPAWPEGRDRHSE